MRARFASPLPVISMVVSGAALPVGPALVQALAARTFDMSDQATLAVGLSAGAFLSGVVNAVVAEARLADAAAAARWSSSGSRFAVLAAALGAGSMVTSPQMVTVVIGFPLLMIALQLGRTDSVVLGSWRTESAAAGLLVLFGSTALVLVPVIGSGAFGLLALGMFLPVALRATVHPVERGLPVPCLRRLLIGAETCVVAAVPLVLTALVLAILGPGTAVAFRLLLTVLGVLQPLLGYLRTVLLARAASRLTAVLTVASALALATVVVAHTVGIPRLLFGAGWSMTTSTLVAACVWKVASIPSTIPFAALRRRGAVVDVLVLRGALSALSVLAATIAMVVTHSLLVVLCALTVVELVAFLAYRWRAAGERLSPSLSLS
ncbi:hypothetical protein [Curtobacterium sp. HSID17257]|uniref:hypothetical protein n=1 Tax=Curtobacterium sp. HSID17257 TaxID=2419510 RepID=UPI000F871C4B|nr:hypothetical protein [Curtobacterium sp. HSID17257]RUQ09746.1 hypothetical protein D8M35_01155 [Curtobacterium sp. HSID17257]